MVLLEYISQVGVLDKVLDRVSCRVTAPTHDLGGLLDIVASRDDLPPLSVDVIDAGLSDHRLLRWLVPMSRPPPGLQYNRRQTVVSVSSTPQLSVTACSSSLLCQPDAWKNYDLDCLARLYDSEISAVLDQLVTRRTITCRLRPSDPWFDDECRNAKRSVCRL